MFCTQCGVPLPAGANFCGSCGRVVDTHDAAGPVAAATPQAAASAAAPARDARYAGFWRRVAASVLDSFILAALNLVLMFIAVLALMQVGLAEDDGSPAVALIYLGGYAIAWLYFAITHSGAHQASPGKRALGIKVTDLEGRRISFARATGRYFAYLVTSLVTLGIGLLMVAFTSRRQALHDLIAGTLVVSHATEPADVARGLESPRVSGGVVALAAFFMLVPVLGILAAIAIPAYQDYLIRTQVSEGLTLAGSYKASVAEAIARGARFADIDNAALGLADARGRYVDSVGVEAGVVVIRFGNGAHDRLVGKTVILVPGATAQGDLLWVCGRAAAPPEVVQIALEAHADYTDVDNRYLPSTCRE